MKISIIIPNYNGVELLKENLPRVIKENPRAEIIVVDDASTDASISFLHHNFPNIKVIAKKENSGFSSAVNLGVSQAWGDLIVLFNTDVYPKKNYLDKSLPYFNDSKTFAVGFSQESEENGRVILRGRGEGEFKRGFLTHRRGEVDRNDTLWVCLGAGIFRRSIWDKLRGLREIYDPFYWEDIDLSFRAQKAGYKIYFENASRVVHQQERGAIRSKYSPQDIKTIAYRNQFLFVWLNYYNPQNLLQHFLWLPYHFLKIRDASFYRGFFQALSMAILRKS